MQRNSLHNPYPVIEKDGTLSFGGNQAWSDSAVMRKCGCGVIGGTDLLLYLSLHKDICRTELFQEAYLENGILELPEYLNEEKVSAGHPLFRYGRVDAGAGAESVFQA